MLLFRCLVLAATLLSSAAVFGQFNKSNFSKQVSLENVNRVEATASGLQYRILYQSKPANNYWKGIVLLADYNDETNPWAGSVDRAELLVFANLFAKNGYIAALVGYRQPQPIASDWSNFNDIGEQIASEISEVGNHIIAKYNGKMTLVNLTSGGTPRTPLSRSKIVTLGISFSCYHLLTNLAYSNTLSGTAGLLAIAGSTGADQAAKLKVPVYSITCNDDNLGGDFFGAKLIGAMRPDLKSRSGFQTDSDCSGHKFGNMSVWAGQTLVPLKFWLP